MKEDFRYLLGLEFQNVFLVSLLLHIYESQKSATKEAGIALTISRDFTALKSRDLMKKDFRPFRIGGNIDKSLKSAVKEVGFALTISRD